MPTVNVNITQQNINGKIRVYLTASATDPDGDTVTYEWTEKQVTIYIRLEQMWLK